MFITRQKIISRIKLGTLRALLWAIRQFGFRLVLGDKRMVYEWVTGLDGSFDHWFHLPEQNYAVSTVQWQLGFWQFSWQVLTQSELLIGRRRGFQNEILFGRSEEYYCSEPIFVLRTVSRRRKKPNATPQLAMKAACTSCEQKYETSLDALTITQLALDHAAATGHVVVLNVTAEVVHV